MQFSVRWQSQPGNRTTDNRDRAGIGLVGDSLLAVVADGSTAGKESGQLAQCLVHSIVDWFAGTSGAIDGRNLSGQLRQIHGSLAGRFARSSASYMIVVVQPQHPCLVGYAGDCILGTLVDGTAIRWLTAPDTLANALAEIPIEQLAKERSRNLLTRSFRPHEFMPPAFRTFDEKFARLLIATDGFWAELPAEGQLAFLSGSVPPSTGEHDDRSVLELASRDLAYASEERLDAIGDIYLRHGV